MIDKRDSARVLLDMDINFRYPRNIQARIRNFSKGGVGVEIPVKLRVDTPIELEVFRSNFLIAGNIRWVNSRKAGFTAGIEFNGNAYDLLDCIQDPGETVI